MGVAGQDALDPRQEKAREEFQKMREQLRRTLERTMEPAPWRDRPMPIEQPPMRTPAETVRGGSLFTPSRWAEVASIAGGSFMLGVIATLAVIGIQGDDTPVPQAALEASQPEQTVAAAPPRVAAPPEAAPVAAAASEPSAAEVAPATTVEATAAEAGAAPALVEAPAPPPPASEQAAVEQPAVAPVAVEAPPEAPVASEPSPATTDQTETQVAAIAPPAPALSEPAPEAAPETAPAPEAAAPPAAPAPQSEPVRASPTSAAQIGAIQTLLAQLGYEPGQVDGAAGAQTQDAARAFAATYGLADSNLDAAFLAALRAASAGQLAPPTPADLGGDPVLDRVNRIKGIQTLLTEFGYEVGRPDGDPGQRTTAAAEDFAAKMNLADANLDAAFLAFLRYEDSLR